MTGLTFTSLLAFGLLAAASPSGETRWMAVSQTAIAITGDISLGREQVVMAGARFPLRRAGEAPRFHADDGDHPAIVSAVTRSMNPGLLNKNRLCDAPVSWIVTWRSGADQLGMAVFSGHDQPIGESGGGLCGTFSYVRGR